MYPNMNAYQKVQKITIDSRTHQAQVLRSAAYRLQEAKNKWGDAHLLHDALQFNLRFWTIVQADGLADDCPLPKEIRVNILRLSSWVDRRTMEIYEDPSPEKLDSLININIQLAEGLEGKS